MTWLPPTCCAVATLLLAACGGSDVSSPAEATSAETSQVGAPAGNETPVSEPTNETGNTDVNGDVNAFEGAPGSIHAVAGDIEYDLDGLYCTLAEREFGPTGQFFLNDGNGSHTVFYAFAPIEGLTNERLTITGPQGVLYMEHKQVAGGEVVNTQTQEPGAFLFDQSAPTLQIEREVLFTVTSPDVVEPTEIAGTVTIDCSG